MSKSDLITEKISWTYYFKSIVDKFSPGFDFYGVPLVKNLMYSIIYGDSKSISNSLQFTFFAENLIIFNYLIDFHLLEFCRFHLYNSKYQRKVYLLELIQLNYFNYINY